MYYIDGRGCKERRRSFGNDSKQRNNVICVFTQQILGPFCFESEKIGDVADKMSQKVVSGVSGVTNAVVSGVSNSASAAKKAVIEKFFYPTL